MRSNGVEENRFARTGGSLEPLFQTTSPPLRGHVTGNPPRADGDPRRAGGGGWGGGGPEVPQHMWLKTIPVIVLRYVSWWDFFFERNHCCRPLRSAGGESSLEF